MSRLRFSLLAAVVVGAVLVPLLDAQSGGAPHTGQNGAGRFSFALIGDMPYGAEGDAKFPNIVAELNADRDLAFVAHDGDFKNGSSLCDDLTFQNRLDLFNGVQHPFVYVPGDNEWTDCHRANNGAYDPLERLTLLRAMFFAGDRSLGQPGMTLERQSDDPAFALYRENVRWHIQGVTFAGLHVVGSNNNLGRTAQMDAEYAARNVADLAWLHDTFARAAASHDRAVMLIIQADPGFELAPAQRTGFNAFLAALQQETIAFGGPVVLVHGDSHYFRIDKPMIGTASGRRVENFTRVETFGELDNHWLHVDVDPGSPNVFVFDQRIVKANLVDQQ